MRKVLVEAGTGRRYITVAVPSSTGRYMDARIGIRYNFVKRYI